MYLKVDTGLSNDGNSDTRSIYPDVRTPGVSDTAYNCYYSHYWFCRVLEDISGGPYPWNNISPTSITRTDDSGFDRIPSKSFVGKVDLDVSYIDIKHSPRCNWTIWMYFNFKVAIDSASVPSNDNYHPVCQPCCRIRSYIFDL